jgi:hypothetical protein
MPSPEIPVPTAEALGDPSPETAATDRYTTKQMGDACEMLVAAELTLAGVPAFKLPDNWPGYDVIAQPFDRTPQRVSVKSRTFKRGNFVGYDATDSFDWLAIVILPAPGCEQRRIFILPRKAADTMGYFTTNRKSGRGYGFFVVKLVNDLTKYENNFRLAHAPDTASLVSPTIPLEGNTDA